jgi:hypothetical protein
MFCKPDFEVELPSFKANDSFNHLESKMLNNTTKLNYLSQFY